MKTCERFTQPDYAAREAFVCGASSRSMSSVEDSRARTSASQGVGPGLMARDRGCGQSMPAWWASYDRATCSWRTSQGSLLEGWDEFLATWPLEGSMRNGRVYQRAPLVQHTCDDGCSLWPTPTASMDGRGFGIPLHERSGRYRLSTVRRVQELVKSHGWRIHPSFTEALMGFPLGWSAIEPLETASTQAQLSGSAVE